MSKTNNTNEHGGTNMTTTTPTHTIANGTTVYDRSHTLGVITGSGFVFGNDVAALYTIKFNDGTITTLSQRDFTVTICRWNVRVSHDDGSVTITTHFQKIEAEKYAAGFDKATIVEAPSFNF